MTATTTAELRADAYDGFRGAAEQQLAAATATAEYAGPEAGAVYERTAGLWRTALAVMELYTTDPLFAGRVDGALREQMRRTTNIAEEGRS